MNDVLDKILKSLDKAVVEDVKVYDMTSKTPFYDYAVIASANTPRQAQAAANYLKDDAIKDGLTLRNNVPTTESNWFLVDLNEVIVHIFVKETRAFYNLDEMYSK